MARWTFEYSTGVRKFDQQHVKLFDVLNDLMTGLSGPHKKAAVKIALADLEIFAETHFAEEEEAMESANYPGLDHHIKEHQRFEEMIIEMQERVEKDPDVVGKELAEFVHDKLARHIKKVDKQYGPVLKGKV